MRKSLAPSLKSKLFSNITKSENFLETNTNSDEKLISKRNTETVLSLLSSINDTKLVENGSNDIPVSISESCNHHNNDNEAKNNKELKEKENTTNSREQCDSFITIYNVVYGKQNKRKHKTWEGDGFLEIGSKYLTLKDEHGKVIGKAPCPKARKLEEGERVFVGSKEVELLEKSVNETYQSVNQHENESLCKKDMKSEIRKKFRLSKRYKCPGLSYTSGLALPDPNPEHQWHFNSNNLPITPVFIDGSLSKVLRQHQYEGITFLYECILGFKDVNYRGAILADEMGLGKTLQCIALIWVLLKQGPYGGLPIIKRTLIVSPSSLVMTWYNEFIKWLGGVKLVPFVVTQKNKPSNLRGPVVIISYEMLVRYLEDLEQHEFDLLICDEGHRLKNSNIKTTQMLCRLNCPRKILLTGTPIQNDLLEFYALLDFVNPNILGTPTEFRRHFVEPILASRQPNADEYVVKNGKESAQNLKKITSQFLLRRTRDLIKNFLPPRHDIVVFCKITAIQRHLYNMSVESFLNAKDDNFISDGSAHLELITTLKKIASHPSLIQKINPNEEPSIENSGKVLVTINFLQELQQNSPKEKVVIVSNSTQTLDILETVLKKFKFKTCRLDGSTPTAHRNRIVEQFNGTNSNTFVFLLSSKAGGVGLNIVGASRLILFDSDWNPATDLQAVSRIWRDGQKHPVYIYRLLSAGTIEEKIYQRQLNKQGLSDGTVDPETDTSIRLSKEELKDIFFLCSDNIDDCLTHDSLLCDCSKQGEVPLPMLEEERSCGLMNRPNKASKISELFYWEHHGRPFNIEFLSQLCLRNSEDEILFLFHNCKV